MTPGAQRKIFQLRYLVAYAESLSRKIVPFRNAIVKSPKAQTRFTDKRVLPVGAFCSIYEFGFHGAGGHWTIWTAIALGLAGWCAWALIFSRMSRMEEAGDCMSRLCRWLLRGSVLELLIAVPTHIVARCRDYCCAGVMTFIGLTLGMSVMLFSFGPGVFFLFAARWQRLHPQASRIER